jgi:hypothetical protein
MKSIGEGLAETVTLVSEAAPLDCFVAVHDPQGVAKVCLFVRRPRLSDPFSVLFLYHPVSIILDLTLPRRRTLWDLGLGRW